MESECCQYGWRSTRAEDLSPERKEALLSIFDSAKEKLQDVIADNPDKVEDVSDQAISKGADLLDSATGGKFSDQIDQGESLADDHVGQG